MLGEATFSPCELYRYTLKRKIERDLLDNIGQAKRSIVFCMLNPSTATADVNDPTVAKCCTYARLWGFSDLTVVNIFAYRSTDPNGLKKVDDPIGPDNDSTILTCAAAADMVLCAWGNHGKLHERGKIVAGMLHNHDIRSYALDWNLDGSPKHPLYLRLDLKPQVWEDVNEYGSTIH